MRLDSVVEETLRKALDGQPISRDEAIGLMAIDLLSPEMYALCAAANQLSWRRFGNCGEVYAQIGLDFAPCPCNCEFCSFGAAHSVATQVVEYSAEAVVEAAKECEGQGANGIYLMTTARYRFDRLLEIASDVRRAVSSELPLVANVSDFDERQAEALAAVGFDAVYHAVRLNEGKGTAIPVARRLRTVEAARKAGLLVHFCVEPVGAEHSAEEQVDLMFLGRELGVIFSGAMRRVCVPGTPAASRGEISWWSLARTVAVCRLVMGDTVLGHCTHEPNLPAVLAGANLLWAETGPNPRDERPDTENNRGTSVSRCQTVLREAGWEIRLGPAATGTRLTSRVAAAARP